MIFRFLAAFYAGMKNVSSGFYYNWGMTYARWGQPARAMYYLNRAARLNTKGAHIFYQRGLLLIAMGQPKSAIADFDAAIRANPNHLDALLNRSLMNTLTGRHDEAQCDVESAVSLGADRSSLEARNAELRNQLG